MVAVLLTGVGKASGNVGTPVKTLGQRTSADEVGSDGGQRIMLTFACVVIALSVAVRLFVYIVCLAEPGEN